MRKFLPADTMWPFFLESCMIHGRTLSRVHALERREGMIYVVVSVRVKADKLAEFLSLFASVTPLVRQETGCAQYVATTDFDTGLPPQVLDKDVVTILERWESLEALQNHLATPHMAAYFEKEKHLTEGSSLKILKEANVS